MTTAFDATLASLPPAERAEIEAILATHASDAWDSDEGDGLVWHAMLAVCTVGGVVATLLNYSPAEILEWWSGLPQILMYSYASPILGFTLALIALPLLARRIVALHGRHGWMVTSFGLVRVRGSDLQIARWQDITRIERSLVGTRLKGFIKVAVTTPRGVLEYLNGALYAEIKRRAPNATLVE